MSTLPLVIGGQTVSVDQLSGYNYVHGYPELAGLLKEHGRRPYFGWTVEGAYVYCTPGKQRILTTPGKSWCAGYRLRASRFGNSGDYRTLRVISYDKDTGLMHVEVVASSTFSTPESGSTGYYLYPEFPEAMGTSLLGISSGAVGGRDPITARSGIRVSEPEDYSEFYLDFLSPEDYCSMNTTGATYVRFPVPGFPETSLQLTFDTHPGYFRFADSDTVAIGRPYLDWTDFSGDQTYFECAIRFEQLVSGYSITFGLLGASAKLVFVYDFSVNSSRFTVVHGVSSSYTTINTTFTPVVSTWYTLKIYVSGSNILFTINGTTVATISKTNYQGVSSSNLMTPQITHTGDPKSPYIDYMYFKKHCGGR